MAKTIDPIRLLRAVPREARPRTLAALIELGSDHDRLVFVPALCELTILAVQEANTSGSSADSKSDSNKPSGSSPNARTASAEPTRACLIAWPWFPDQYRRVMRSVDLDWASAAVSVLETAPPRHRVRLPEVASDLPEIIPILTRLLTDPDPQVVSAGSQGLLDLATRAVAARDLHLARVTAAALLAALDSFDSHRQRTVIQAVWRLLESPAWTASLGRPGVSLIEWFRTSKAASRSAARSVLRTGNQPWLRARAIAWLAEPAAQTAAIDRLARAQTNDDHAITLDNIHLLSRPARAKVLPMLGPGTKPVTIPKARASESAKPIRRVVPGGPIPTRAQVEHLTGRSARSLPQWLGLLGLDASDLAMACEPLLVSVDPRARHSLARSLDESRVRDLLFDPDSRVSRHAAYRWSLAGVNARAAGEPCAADAKRLQQARQLMRAPCPLIRRVAAEQTYRFDPLVWAHPMARVQARRRHHKDPAAFTAQLREALESQDQTHKLGAAMAALCLGLGSELREPLAAIIMELKPHDPAASVAIRALVRTILRDEPVCDESIILAALEHPDPRVKANTLEELARCKNRKPEAAIWGGWDVTNPDRWLDDRAHRLRAAAVRASLAEPKLAAVGRSALLSMLGDDSAMHRVSGAWLACRARVVDAAGRLRDLALDDPDSAVRARADWALRRLASPVMRSSA